LPWSDFAVGFAETFFASEFLISERRANRSLFWVNKNFFKGWQARQFSQWKGDSPDANGAVHQVALPNQDIKNEAQWYAAFDVKEKAKPRKFISSDDLYTFFNTAFLSY
jgi:hypothetical protein